MFQWDISIIKQFLQKILERIEFIKLISKSFQRSSYFQNIFQQLNQIPSNQKHTQLKSYKRNQLQIIQNKNCTILNMGNQQQAFHKDQQSAVQIIKRKQQIEFKQNDFIRQIQGSIQIQYQILSPYLRHNQFYQLRKAIHKKTKLIRSVYIINKYKVRTNQRQLLEDQINKLKQIDHANINKIYELYKDSHRFFIVMELCNGQSLASMLERQRYISEKRAAEIMHQIFNILAYCHKRDILHTDLKLENIIFNSSKNDILKIVDYSISKIFRIQDIIEQSQGKAYLSSPETLRGEITTKSDIWQCGMILYILLSGQAPIIGMKKGKLARKIMFYIPNFSQKRFDHVSKEAKQFIKCLLKLSPNDRPTAQICLQSAWIKKYYKEPIISSINLKRCLMECYHFNPLSKLQEATWTFFVNALVPFSQKQNILYVFYKLDVKNKGQLQFQQIFQAFKQIHQNEQKARFLTQCIFRRLKRDKITFSHFLTISTNRIFLITQSNIKKIFQIFDEDNSGEISVNELKHVLGSSKQVNQQIWLQLMKQADANSDGMISFEQFKDLMKSLLKKQNEELFQQLQLKNNKDIFLYLT